MGRKSSIVRLSAPAKSALDRALKDGRYTLDEILTYLRSQFPAESMPTRSAVGRYKQGFDALTKDLRETREIAGVWAQKLGDAPESDIGKVVLEILRTLSYRVGADLMSGETDLDAKAVAQLARAMQFIEDAGRMGIDREAKVRKAAVEAAAQRMEQAAKKAGAGADTIDALRAAITREIAA